METIIATGHSNDKEAIDDIPRCFRANEGELLYHGRNEIRRFTIDGNTVVAKKFKHLGLLKAIIYTYFRKNKALRSYENAITLRRRHVDTPQPIAYIAERRGGLIRDVYYVSAETTMKDIKSELIERKDYDRRMVVDYARFVANLHENGILHRDLNPTNVLFRKVDDDYEFQLIDINRMTFYDEPVPKEECMENLTLFWWLTPVYEKILKEYCVTRGWTEDDYDEAILVKKRHDRRWIRRKNFTHALRRKTMKQA